MSEIMKDGKPRGMPDLAWKVFNTVDRMKKVQKWHDFAVDERNKSEEEFTELIDKACADRALSYEEHTKKVDGFTAQLEKLGRELDLLILQAGKGEPVVVSSGGLKSVEAVQALVHRVLRQEIYAKVLRYATLCDMFILRDVYAAVYGKGDKCSGDEYQHIGRSLRTLSEWGLLVSSPSFPAGKVNSYRLTELGLDVYKEVESSGPLFKSKDENGNGDHTDSVSSTTEHENGEG
jgi:hypothetical protein